MKWEEDLMIIDNVVKNISLTRTDHYKLSQSIQSLQHYIRSLEVKTLENDKRTITSKAKKDLSTNGYAKENL